MIDRRRFLAALPAAALVSAAGCATVPAAGPPMGSEAEIAELALAIRALGPGVDPEEAARAARTTFGSTRRQALAYEVEDPPLIHNTKVNMGIKPRGLCWHWAEDLEQALRAERFETLTLHRAIANSETFLIDHSTVILSARGDGMFQGIVLDGWRNSGDLFWSPTLEDTRYDWVPRAEVFRRRAARES